MINKIKYVVALFCSWMFALNSINAQNAVVKENNLEDSPNLSLGVISGLDVFDPNFNGYFGAQASYRFKGEKIWLGGYYYRAYFDRLEAITENNQSLNGIPAEGTKPLKMYEVKMGYNIVTRNDYRYAKTTFFKRSAVITKIKLPVKSYRLYGVHAGYGYFRTIVAQGSSMEYSGPITADFPKDTIVSVSNATPMLSMNLISLGVHRQKIFHAVIQTNNEGTILNYSDKSYAVLYGDVLIATKMTLENILVPISYNAPNTNPPSGSNSSGTDFNYYNVNVNGSHKKIPIGGRIGGEYTSLSKIGYTVGFECGFRPGLVTPENNLYMQFKFALLLNVKAK
jgi:hypothetical protein